jgi:hypothetical protein
MAKSWLNSRRYFCQERWTNRILRAIVRCDVPLSGYFGAKVRVLNEMRIRR